MDKRKETTVTVSMVKLNFSLFFIIIALSFGIGYLHIFLSGGGGLKFHFISTSKTKAPPTNHLRYVNA